MPAPKASRGDIMRWVGWLVLVVVFAVACWQLSQWQLSRRAQVVEVINRIDRNYEFESTSLVELVPRIGSFRLDNEYRLVQVTGTYLPEQALLVRNRPRNGQAGFEQLVPFRLDSGKFIFVNRGWLPTGSRQDSPDLNPLPMGSTSVVITGRLRHSQGTDGRSAPEGQIAHPHIPEAAQRAGLPAQNTYLAVYLLMESESPSAPAPKTFTKPQIGEGNHLSYAFQWLLFALMAFGVLLWAIRQERLQVRAKTDPNFVLKKRRKLGQDDQDYEDG